MAVPGTQQAREVFYVIEPVNDWQAKAADFAAFWLQFANIRAVMHSTTARCPAQGGLCRERMQHGRERPHLSLEETDNLEMSICFRQ